MSHSAQGYYGSSYDRYQAHNEQSTIHKMKETYWTTKQAVIKKLGKKEDQHIVASDQQLDSKLEVFKAIQRSCMELLRTLEKYQDRLCALSQEENGMGRFLKSHSQQDKTRAGKMMAAVGKSLSFSSQQRLALRVPLVRLYQEVETFRYRAISDTLMTINRMESARTEYRGALLWMKDISEHLDPDTHKQLEKFRKVQAQVRKSKATFDRLKLDTMQKIDLLAASRCNMFSHVLANYQTTLLHFWSKTSHTMTAVADSFKGYQYYEFNMLKELCEPAKKLAEETGNKQQAERDTDGQDGDEEYESGEEDDAKRETSSTGRHDSMADAESIDRLISFDEEGREAAKELDADNDAGSMTNLLRGDDSTKSGDNKLDKRDSFIDFGDEEEQSLEEIKEKQNKEFSGQILRNLEEQKNTRERATKVNKDLPSEPTPQSEQPKQKSGQDLLSGDFEVEEGDKDDMTLLNEILNAPSTGEDDFTKEWQAVFGNTPLNKGTNYTPVESDQTQLPADFMPSNLLDMTGQMSALSMNPGAMGMPPMGAQMMAGQQTRATAGGQPLKQGAKPAGKKGEKNDMSAWFSLFADLDPLANPDAIGKSPEDMTDA